MEIKKLVVAMGVVSGVVLLTACGSDSKSSSSKKADPAPSSSVTKSNDKTGACSAVATHSGLDIKMEDGSFKPLCELEGTVSENATLSADNVYRLRGYVTVGTGNGEIELKSKATSGTEAVAEKKKVTDAGVTLTVEAGTHFRSSGRGSLIITRGSKLMAEGTAAAPIVMSSIDAGYEGQGEWGGLVLQGFAKNNKCGEGSNEVLCNTADEAGTGFHGGNDDADNTGSIKHLIVAEGGYEVAPDSEVNGITLHSVGYGTTIENVMVLNNADDGIEFFGGAANVKNLILVDNGDESLDWDDGWRGNVQFALIRQGLVNKGDHGIEADNKGRATDANPQSKPTVANVTFQTGPEGADDLFRFKEGTGGMLVNVAADNYAECVLLEEADTGRNGSLTLTNVLLECTPYANGTLLNAKDSGVAGNITGVPGASATVDLGNAFQVTGSESTLASAATFTSANDSTNFFDAAGASYVGAVAPTVSDKANAWWAWADKVVPAAFK